MDQPSELQALADFIFDVGLVIDDDTDELAVQATAVSRIAERFPDATLAMFNEAMRVAIRRASARGLR